MDAPAQSPEDVFFHPINGVEDMRRYCAGGYHPVSIGDKFNQYRVVHKLGHGNYSTVWLARDERRQRLVALKICTADAGEREAKTLSRLSTLPSDASKSNVMSGKDSIPVLLGTFSVHGSHGVHTCLVTKVARCTLKEARRRSWGRPLQLHVARAMVAQLVLAVAYLHKHGYIHGDLHVGNIVIQHPDPEKLGRLSDKELYERIGEPEFEAVQTFDDKPIPENVPIAAILPLAFLVKTNELSPQDACILLGDFSEVYSTSQEQRLNCRALVHCRPPDDFFQAYQPWSFSSDV